MVIWAFLPKRQAGFSLQTFFSEKAQKGFTLQSLTQLEIEIYIPKSILKSLTAMDAKEYAKFAKHFNKKILVHFAVFYLRTLRLKKIRN